jgi:hypothetical protein
MNDQGHQHHAMHPAAGESTSTVIVAINAQLLARLRSKLKSV